MQLKWKQNFTPPIEPYAEGGTLKNLSYQFYASPDGRKVAARLRGLRRKVLIMYGVVGLFSGVSIVLGLSIYNLLKGGM